MSRLTELRKLNAYIRSKVTTAFNGMEDSKRDPLQQSRRQIRLHASGLLKKGRTPKEVQEHLEETIFKD